MTLHGAAGFRNRLAAIARAGEPVARRWADESVRRVRGEIPRRTGQTAASIHAERVSKQGARVVGSQVVNFLASGTRAHQQEPKNAQAMRFRIGGQTIFSKKVFHPATQGNPRIRQAAREALRTDDFADTVHDLWDRAD